MKPNIKKYKVTTSHGFIKPGVILSRGRTKLMLLHDLGVETYEIDVFNKWLTMGWIIPNSNKKKYRLSLNQIMNAISVYLKVSEKAFKTKSRQGENPYAKRLFSYFAKEYTGYSLREIGEYMRLGYDHSTVHWGHKKISESIGIDLVLATDVYCIKKELNLVK